MLLTAVLLGVVARFYRTPPLRCQSSVSESWLEDGLAFSCTMCGNCCSGSSGSVRFTPEEAEAMAAAKGVSIDEFYREYTRVRGRASRKHLELREVRTDFGLDCVFLDRLSLPGKAVCSLYSARPTQCKTWPFWKEVVDSRSTWLSAAEDCPGIGKGPTFTKEFILREVNRLDPES